MKSAPINWVSMVLVWNRDVLMYSIHEKVMNTLTHEFRRSNFNSMVQCTSLYCSLSLRTTIVVALSFVTEKLICVDSNRNLRSRARIAVWNLWIASARNSKIARKFWENWQNRARLHENFAKNAKSREKSRKTRVARAARATLTALV